jgi:hypothetical protein
MSGYLTRLGARLVHSTTLIDRAYHGFDRLRSLVVLAFASESFLEEHCKLAYGASPSYRADSPEFRRGLFKWEELAVRDFFPAPPARVLLGGAGGGREAYALIEMGYTVVAFDPAPTLAASMREKALREYSASLQAYCAGYEDLPMLRDAPEGQQLDVRSLAPFDAAILGWSSFSHLIDDSARVAALKQFASLTRGPILVSYFSHEPHAAPAVSGGGPLNALRRRALRHGVAMFTTAIGYARLLSEEELKGLADRAGLLVVHVDRERGWPHAILRGRESERVTVASVSGGFQGRVRGADSSHATPE